jgi:hypothetical protein
MNRLFLILLVVSFSNSYAQSTCSCEKNFDEIYQKVKDNYSAYEMKITPVTKPKFEELSKKVKEKSKGVSDPKACFNILKEWTEYFKDGHLFINSQTSFTDIEAKSDVEARAAKLGVQKFNSEAKFEAQLKSVANSLQTIEGIWESDDKAYRIGIIKSEGNKYWGFLLNNRDNLWIAGKNKFLLEPISDNKFKTTYYYADFTSEVTLSTQFKNVLRMDNIYKYYKISPSPKESVSQDELIHSLPDYRVEKIDNDNTLLVLPPFTIPNAPTYVKELVNQNIDLIRSSKNLIIDLRNNPGGDETAFDAVFPLLANGPIVRKGSKIRASAENLILLNHELKAIQDYPQYQSYLDPKLRDIIRKMQRNPNTMIDAADKIFDFKQSSNNPQKVVILANKNTASSAESLILESKQSSKVIFMGTNTKGLADYTEVRDWGLPCFGWRLALPLGYSHRLPSYPIEFVGIKPDVAIPESEVDWVGYVVKHLSTIK